MKLHYKERTLKQRFAFERKFRAKGVIASARSLLFNLIGHQKDLKTLTASEQFTIGWICSLLGDIQRGWDDNTEYLESYLGRVIKVLVK